MPDARTASTARDARDDDVPGNARTSNARGADADDDVAGNARTALVVAAVASVVLPALPFVGLLLRPFVWLQTFMHELGHALCAVALGSHTFMLRVFADGSGVTPHDGLGDTKNGIVAAAGLIGPACAAALFFVFARRRAISRVALVVLGALLVAGAVAVVDNVFGRVVVGAWGALFLALGARLKPVHTQIACAFVGVDLGLSVFSRGDYLFTATAHTAEGPGTSDVASVAASFGGFYLVWGALIGVVSVAIVAAGLALLLRRSSKRSSGDSGHRARM